MMDKNTSKIIAIIIPLLIVGVLVAAYLVLRATPALDSENSGKDVETSSESEEGVENNGNSDNETQEAEVVYDFKGDLVDVTSEVSSDKLFGIDTGGNASGIAKYTYADGEYFMYATFENLPDPENGAFYEGWLVRKEPFAFVSSGPAKLMDGVYVNEYMSGTDYSEYDFYVLTIEPDDGDPAPAAHVLEGLVDTEIQ